jgi:hypothetical protein
VALDEVASFMPQPPALSRLDREVDVAEKKEILSLSEINLRFLVHLAHCIIIILIQLSQLRNFFK